MNSSIILHALPVPEWLGSALWMTRHEGQEADAAGWSGMGRCPAECRGEGGGGDVWCLDQTMLGLGLPVTLQESSTLSPSRTLTSPPPTQTRGPTEHNNFK